MSRGGTSFGIGTVRVDLTANTVEFKGGFDQALKLIDQYQSRVRVATNESQKSGRMIGAAGRGAAEGWTMLKAAITGVVAILGARQLVGAFRQTAEMVENIGLVSRRLGLTTEKTSELRFIADQANVPFDQMAKMAKTLEVRLSEIAKTGKGEAAAALKELGLQTAFATGKLSTLDKSLPAVARAIENISDPGRRLRLAEQLFGDRNGQAFIDLIGEAGSFLEMYAVQAERARRLGVVFDKDTVGDISEMNNSIKMIGEAWTGIKVKVLKEIAPFVAEASQSVASIMAAAPKMMLRTVDLVREAIRKPGIDEVGPTRHHYALQLFENLGNAGKDFIVEAFEGAFRIVVAGVPVFVNEFMDALTSETGQRMLSWVQKLPLLIAKAYNKAQLAANESLGIFSGDKKMLQDRIDAVDNEMRLMDRVKTGADVTRLIEDTISKIDQQQARIQEAIAKSRETNGYLYDLGADNADVNVINAKHQLLELERYLERLRTLQEDYESYQSDRVSRDANLKNQFQGLDNKVFKATLDDVGNRLRESGRKFLGAADDVLGFTQAVSETSVKLEDVKATLGDVGVAIDMATPPPSARDRWKEFGEGVRLALDKMNTELDDFTALGERATETAVRGFGNEFASALFKAEGSVSKFASNAVDAFGNVVQSVAEMIVQFSLMRAVTAGLDYVYGSFNSSASQARWLQTTRTVGMPTDRVQAANGAMVGRGGDVIRAANGAMITSPTLMGMPSGTQVLMGENPSADGELMLPVYKDGEGYAIRGSGGGTTVNVYDYRSGSSDPVNVQRRVGAGGEAIVDIMIGRSIERYFSSGRGDGMMQQAFGVKRAARS